MKDKNPIILAHRGYRAKYPENTILSFKMALKADADGWECDIQKTKDGKFAVIHDDTVDRVSNSKGLVKNMTLAEIKKISLGAKQSVPSLEEMLKAIPGNRFLDLELKAETIRPADCPAIYRILHEHRNASNLMVSSFDAGLLDYFKNKGIPVGLLFGNNVRETGYIRFFRTAFRKDPDYFNLPVQSMRGIFSLVSRPLILNRKLHGKKIAFWVVNNESDLRLCLPSADLIITDDPEWLVRALKHRRSSHARSKTRTCLPNK